MVNTPLDQWYPVARADDLPMHHVFHGQLHGVELALWRADDGQVNAWENRCPHRSVRLSLGVNTGATLRCQYHGWQYQSGDGRCIHMPAAADGAPPRSLCAQAFATAQAHGYVWVNLAEGAAAGPVPEAAPLPVPLPVPLRSLVIRAGADAVAAALERYAEHESDAPLQSQSAARSGNALDLAWESAGVRQRIRFWLQPADGRRTIVHASAEAAGMDERTLLHWHNQRLSALRRHVERGEAQAAGGRPANAPPNAPADVPAEALAAPVQMPVLPAAARASSGNALFKATVAERWTAAEDIAAFRLALPAGMAVEISAGAHIDVHTPAGLVRQYSLVNAPHERDAYIIGTKLEPASRGGSSSMHSALAVGDSLTVSRPKNHFALVPGEGGLLIAGGIGITPILAMGAALQAAGLPYALHYFSRSQAHVAFGERLAGLEGIHVHAGLAVEATRQAVDAALEKAVCELADGCQVYVCGPRPLIDMVRERALAAGIAEQRVHFELFSNAVSHEADRPFRVRLAQRKTEFTVPAGTTLADMLKAHGVAIDTSCEQGVCGTCRTGVIEGEPEHRDVYLTNDEKRENRCLLPCVSRSRSDLLVLDL